MTCARCEDIVWLAQAGETLERIAQRLGVAAETIRVHAIRHHLDVDLVRQAVLS